MPVEVSLILMHFFKIPLFNPATWTPQSTEADEVLKNTYIEI